MDYDIDYKIGDRIEYEKRKATILGFTNKNSNKYFQIVFDESNDVKGHSGNDMLFDSNGKEFTVGSGISDRWNLDKSDRNIKKIVDIETNDDFIDQKSLDFIKQGITRI